MRRRVVLPGVRADMAAHFERLLELAQRLDDEAAVAVFTETLDRARTGAEVPNLAPWEVSMPPNSGRWTLTAADQLVPYEPTTGGAA